MRRIIWFLVLAMAVFVVVLMFMAGTTTAGMFRPILGTWRALTVWFGSALAGLP